MKGSLLLEKHDGESLDILVGNERLLADHDVILDRQVLEDTRKWQKEGKTVILVGGRRGHQMVWTFLAMFAMADVLRPEAQEVLLSLKAVGIETWMISGDNIETARAISEKVGILREHVIAGVLPEEKAIKIRELRRRREASGRLLSRGAVVAMVGDGVNDSPALAVSDVGIAIGSGSDVAVSAAAFVLVNSNLSSLLTLITLSKSVFRRVKFNFVWALMYNLIALPVAAGVLYPIKNGNSHVRLDPVWASLAMALSSVSVVCSSLLLRTQLPIFGYSSKIKRKY